MTSLQDISAQMCAEMFAKDPVNLEVYSNNDTCPVRLVVMPLAHYIGLIDVLF